MALVPVFDNATLPPATTDPEGSFTVPSTVPKVDWPSATEQLITAQKIPAKQTRKLRSLGEDERNGRIDMNGHLNESYFWRENSRTRTVRGLEFDFFVVGTPGSERGDMAR